MPRVFALLDKGGRHRGEIATELKREVPALGDVDLTSISMQHELALDSLRRAFGKDELVRPRAVDETLHVGLAELRIAPDRQAHEDDRFLRLET